MSVVRVLSAALIALVGMAVFTFVYVLFLVRGTKATSMDALRALTIYSPVYWLLVIAVLAALWFGLFRGWFKAT